MHGTPEREYDQDAVARRVRKAMKLLTSSQQKMITLVDLMGFSYSEVASILDLPAGTVMSRLSRARQRLKAILLDGQRRSSDSVTNLYKLS